MIRVVIDTNVIVSSLLRPGGLPETVFRFAIAGEFRTFISAPILAEYEEVLRRPRFRLDSRDIDIAIGGIKAKTSLLHPNAEVTAALDPDDNIFLECAEAAEAHFLVTGNIRDFPATWLGTRIVTPRQFLETITAPEGAPS